MGNYLEELGRSFASNKCIDLEETSSGYFGEAGNLSLSYTPGRDDKTLFIKNKRVKVEVYISEEARRCRITVAPTAVGYLSGLLFPLNENRLAQNLYTQIKDSDPTDDADISVSSSRFNAESLEEVLDKVY